MSLNLNTTSSSTPEASQTTSNDEGKKRTMKEEDGGSDKRHKTDSIEEEKECGNTPIQGLIKWNLQKLLDDLPEHIQERIQESIQVAIQESIQVAIQESIQDDLNACYQRLTDEADDSVKKVQAEERSKYEKEIEKARNEAAALAAARVKAENHEKAAKNDLKALQGAYEKLHKEHSILRTETDKEIKALKAKNDVLLAQINECCNKYNAMLMTALGITQATVASGASALAGVENAPSFNTSAATVVPAESPASLTSSAEQHSLKPNAIDLMKESGTDMVASGHIGRASSFAMAFSTPAGGRHPLHPLDEQLPDAEDCLAEVLPVKEVFFPTRMSSVNGLPRADMACLRDHLSPILQDQPEAGEDVGSEKATKNQLKAPTAKNKALQAKLSKVNKESTPMNATGGDEMDPADEEEDEEDHAFCSLFEPLQNGQGMYRLFVADDGTGLVEYEMFSRHKDGKRYSFIARQNGKGGYCGNCVRPCYWCEGGCSMHRLT